MKSPAGKIRLLDWRVFINESLNVETSFFQSVLRVYLHDHKTKRMSFSLHSPIHIFKPHWNILHSASINNDAVSSRCRSITAYCCQSVFKRKSNLFKSRINTAVQCMSFHMNYFIQVPPVCSSVTLHSSCHHLSIVNTRSHDDAIRLVLAISIFRRFKYGCPFWDSFVKVCSVSRARWIHWHGSKSERRSFLSSSHFARCQ